MAHRLRMVIKLAGDMVIAIGQDGRQSPSHQGPFADVKLKIVHDANDKTKFFQEDAAGDLVRVSKEQWGRK
jgi:hypothetical protein